MRVLTTALQVFLLVALLGMLSPPAAHAYLDPGSGSYILQILIGALLGAAFAVKMFWLRIRAFFSNLMSKKAKDD